MHNLLMVIILACGLTGHAYAEVKIVVNNDSSIESLDAKNIEALFLGRKKKFPDGTKAVPVTLGKGAISAEFLKTYVKRSESQFSCHWKKAIFSGQGKPPKKFTSETELLSYIAATPGTIGYVSAAADLSSSKTIVIK